MQFISDNEKMFPKIIASFMSILKDEATVKVVEVSMDFLEFLLSSFPEAIFGYIE